MKPLVSFLSAALHGIFRPKRNGGKEKAGGNGVEGTDAAKNSPEQEGKGGGVEENNVPGEEESSAEE